MRSIPNHYMAAQNRYGAIRQMVYEQTMRRFTGITAKEITHADTQTADAWKSTAKNTDRKHSAGWNWHEVYATYHNQPNRFDISLWRGSTLGALCYGKTSAAGHRVRLDLIESTPARPSPLGMAALPVLAFAGAAFAILIGATEVWILDPIPELEGLYQAEGFSPRMNYSGKQVGQRRIL